MPNKDPEKARAMKALWYKKNHSAILARAKIWRAANRDKTRAANAVYRAQYPEKFLAAGARWRAANPERVRANRKAYFKTKIPEAKIEAYLVECIEKCNGLCIKFIDPGQRGAPDRLVVLPNRPTYFVELKRPKLGRVGPHQVRYHERLRALGQRVWVLWSKEDVDAFITEVTLT